MIGFSGLNLPFQDFHIQSYLETLLHPEESNLYPEIFFFSVSKYFISVPLKIIL